MAVTVITPSLSWRHAFREECITSVIEQTEPVDAHLVGIDVCAVGPATIRNRLAGAADTEWVVFLDDDDLLDSNYIETIAPHLGEGVDVVYTWCRVVGRSDVGWCFPFNEQTLRQANYIPVTAAIRTERFLQVDGFPVGVAYEDWGLWLRLLDAGARFLNVPTVAWSYRWHESNRSFLNDTLVGEGKEKAV